MELALSSVPSTYLKSCLTLVRTKTYPILKALRAFLELAFRRFDSHATRLSNHESFFALSSPLQ
jgi:hypothetical protein